jgi:transcriptional regulator with XRE-family HTH domain
MAQGLTEGSRFGGFRIVRYLGEGAAGRVYLATVVDPTDYARSGDLIALKVYKPEILREPNELARIRREFDAGSANPHPNLVRVFGHSVESGSPFLVMEYVDGTTLDQWIKMFHPVPGDLRLRMVRQATAAINHLHERGICHRDIKPENIVVTPTFDLKVMDLGVVWSAKGTPLTPEGEPIHGTTRNASPELLSGDEFDYRTDLYSLGTAIYALLHGHQVFAEEEQSARLRELVIHEPPAFDDALKAEGSVTAGLLALCKRLLSKDRSARPDGATDVLAELQRLEAMAPVSEFEPVLGYVATALTGLDPDAKEATDFAALKIAEVAKAFGIYVYQPRRFTDPVANPSIDPSLVYRLDKRRVVGADVLFVLANKPSFGVGQELEIAASYAKPTILLSREGSVVSRMMRGSLANLVGEVSYASPEDLETKLRRLLGDAVPQLRTWRQRAGKAGVVIARRFQALREEAGYASAAEFAKRVGVPAALVEAIERGEHENIGLQLLDILAAELGIPVLSLLDESAPRVAPTRSSDRNLERLDEFAREMGMSADEYCELRDDYEHQIAASGESNRLMKKDWMERRQKLQQRKFQEKMASSAEQTELPL